MGEARGVQDGPESQQSVGHHKCRRWEGDHHERIIRMTLLMVTGVDMQLCPFVTLRPQGRRVKRHGTTQKKQNLMSFNLHESFQVLWSLVVRRETAGAKSNHALDQLELDPDTGETVSCR